ncbi:nucleoside-diphosphate sugar epimerase [Corynebacterium deserti GIMN1.010]|uniref:Nucleoside-diphosphate sugar epimerase n=1 Tax=Corynebacterium deserti GIMN1.010 TaxID=931089 RepID=A0A0M4CQ97_9CORY|nr:TIGR01777 family oxidoreductase [Corynebacterium deserti]ALC06017.1 nucleoside-diphosphate sugar epimerase [Corynebacterium deserti GIMN1.010]
MSLTTSHFIPFPRDVVWDWHTRKGAITRLTPPFTPLNPIQQAERLSDGTTIFALPAGLKWVARHDLSGFLNGSRFTDVCVSAPVKALANWRHVHNFIDQDGGTLITDSVSTRLPASALSGVFAYRQNQLIHDLKFLDRTSTLFDGAPLTVAITGSRGLVGRALTAQLQTGGHTVIQLVRKEPKEGQRRWDPNNPAQDLLDGVDVLVHLAGEPIFGRFNDSHKEAIRNSRTTPTKFLAELVAASEQCTTMISASAIGIYGHSRGDEVLTEDSTPGDDFLADVCLEWEAATQPAIDAGKRVALVRTGVALSGRGGMLPLLKTLFSTGLGGKIGDGTSWFSWIALDDLTDIYYRAIVDKQLAGPINAVAPTPVSNAEMTKVLAASLHRPAIIQIPSLGPKILLGSQGAEELALADQRTAPAALDALGHVFRYTDIGAAIAHELGHEQLADFAQQQEIEAERKQERAELKAARKAAKKAASDNSKEKAREESREKSPATLEDPGEVEQSILSSILNFRRKRSE